MELNAILVYQDVDKQLFNLEKDLAKNPYKLKCNALNQTAKDSQVKSSQLEEQAGSILSEMEELKKTISSTKKHGEELLKKDVSKLSADEISENLATKDKVLQNLSLLDKRLTKLAESINQVLAEFNKTIKNYNEAKAQYQKYKAAYDEVAKQQQPKIDALKGQLQNLAKTVPQETMEIYNKKRADKIFPVFVEVMGNNCGRCRMELSASALSKLKREHILTCENCRSIIYSK